MDIDAVVKERSATAAGAPGKEKKTEKWSQVNTVNVNASSIG